MSPSDIGADPQGNIIETTLSCVIEETFGFVEPDHSPSYHHYRSGQEGGPRNEKDTPQRAYVEDVAQEQPSVRNEGGDAETDDAESGEKRNAHKVNTTQEYQQTL
jgi:hypothetical protein